MADTVYTIHRARDHGIVACYSFRGNVGIDHAYQADQQALNDDYEGKGTTRYYLHNGVGVIAAFLTRNGKAHQILRDDYMKFSEAAKKERAMDGLPVSGRAPDIQELTSQGVLIMDNRTMPERGFTLSAMSDHEFAAWVRKRDLTYRQHLIGTVWTDRQGDSVAVVTYDNAACTRNIWIKES